MTPPRPPVKLGLRLARGVVYGRHIIEPGSILVRFEQTRVDRSRRKGTGGAAICRHRLGDMSGMSEGKFAGAHDVSLLLRAIAEHAGRSSGTRAGGTGRRIGRRKPQRSVAEREP